MLVHVMPHVRAWHDMAHMIDVMVRQHIDMSTSTWTQVMRVLVRHTQHVHVLHIWTQHLITTQHACDAMLASYIIMACDAMGDVAMARGVMMRVMAATQTDTGTGTDTHTDTHTDTATEADTDTTAEVDTEHSDISSRSSTRTRTSTDTRTSPSPLLLAWSRFLHCLAHHTCHSDIHMYGSMLQRHALYQHALHDVIHAQHTMVQQMHVIITRVTRGTHVMQQQAIMAPTDALPDTWTGAAVMRARVRGGSWVQRGAVT